MDTEVNVNGSQSTADRMIAAQQRLAKAVLSQPINNPASLAISSYVNSVLNSARMDGVIAFLTTEYNASWSKEEALDAAVLASVLSTAEKLEENIRKIQVAGPSLLSPH